MLYKNVASQKLACFAYTASTGAAKTGDAAQITAYLSKDFAAAAAVADTNPTELDATNMPGWYVFDLTQAETNAEVIILAAKSSTSGVLIEQIQVLTQDAAISSRLAPTTAGRTLDVSAGGEAGIDWANVGNPTTTVGLSGTTIKASTDTETDIAALPTAVEIVAAIDADPPAVNVTMQGGVAVAAADANGNIPVNIKTIKGSLAAVDGLAGLSEWYDAETYVPVLGQEIRDAMKLAPSAGAPAEGSVDAKLDDLPTAAENADAVWDEAIAGHAIVGSTGAALSAAGGAGDPWSTPLPGAYGAGTAGALLSGIDSNVDLLLAADTSTSDATTAGAISRRRGNSWAIPLTIGAITGYTSLWFTIKSSYDDADTSALVQVKLNSPSALDGLLYVNGTTASSAALGSITVSDATTGVIVVNVDETITDDLAPGEYCYDVQTLIAGDVATPDSGTFTVTADVTRSVT